MNVTKLVAALTLAALAIPSQAVYGGGKLIPTVSGSSLTSLKLDENHPGSTFGGNTYTLPGVNIPFWSVTGTVTDHNASLFATPALDTVTVTGMTLSRIGDPSITVPTFAAAPSPTNGGSAEGQKSFGNWMGKVAATNGGTDYYAVSGAYSYTASLSKADIWSYAFTVIGEYSAPGARPPEGFAALLTGASEKTAVTTHAYGDMAAFYNPSAGTLDLDLALMRLQASNITGIQITSSAPGFTTLNLGTSALQIGPNGDAVAFGADVSIPSSDVYAIETGNAFVNVLTYNNPGGEIGGMLSPQPVPEPSTWVLLATGLAFGFLRYGWRQRKSGALSASRQN